MTFISLFAGIGGLDLGLERAGMQCVAQVEIDEYCRKVLTKHWPEVPKYADVREVGKHNLPTADLICGGFPCQDISNAGKRVGIEGERSGLWREYHRIICEIRPRYIVVENVAALLNRGIDRVLGDLAALGYDAEWSVLSACAVGASHTRARLFIVAYPVRNGWNGRRERQSGGGGITQRETIFGPHCSATTEGLNKTFGWWARESGVDRMAHGVPGGGHRRKALGNAVVPQKAEFIGHRIIEFDKAA